MFNAHPEHVLLSATNERGEGHVSIVHEAFDVGAEFEIGAVPSGHEKIPTRHEDCFASANEPSRHSLQVADPTAAKRPVAHWTQVEATEAPVTALALPTEHEVQLEAPAED